MKNSLSLAAWDIMIVDETNKEKRAQRYRIFGGVILAYMLDTDVPTAMKLSNGCYPDPKKPERRYHIDRVPGGVLM